MALIFDVGAFNGDDTAAYLARGFRVVAVEANPTLCDDMHNRFEKEIKLGRVFIVNKAVDRRSGGKITLHVHPHFLYLGSAIERYVPRDLAQGGEMVTYDVPTISLSSLIEEHGKPHYIKIDVEGMEGEAIAGLSPSQAPRFISIERPVGPRNYVRAILTLRRLGYTQFQIVEQFMVASGALFGDELPTAWVSHVSAIAENVWITFRAGIIGRIPGLSHLASRGRWFDIHAAKERS